LYLLVVRAIIRAAASNKFIGVEAPNVTCCLKARHGREEYLLN